MTSKDITLDQLVSQLADDHPARVEYCDLIAEAVSLRKQRDALQAKINGAADDADRLVVLLQDVAGYDDRPDCPDCYRQGAEEMRERAAAVVSSPDMRLAYVVAGPRCLAAAAKHIEALPIEP